MRRINRWRWVFFLVAWGCAFSCKNTTPAEKGSAVAAAANGPGKVKKAVRLKIPNYPLRTEKDLDVLLEEIQILHQLSPRNKLIFSKDIRDNKYMKRPVGHRAIGVVYNPQLEHLENYVPSIIPKRYDAFLFIDTSQALHPLGMPPTENEPPDVYPWGT